MFKKNNLAFLSIIIILCSVYIMLYPTATYDTMYIFIPGLLIGIYAFFKKEEWINVKALGFFLELLLNFIKK